MMRFYRYTGTTTPKLYWLAILKNYFSYEISSFNETWFGVHGGVIHTYTSLEHQERSPYLVEHWFVKWRDEDA